MNRTIFARCILFLILSCAVSFAQGPKPNNSEGGSPAAIKAVVRPVSVKKAPRTVPWVRLGFSLGRSGVAFGGGPVLEVNPSQYFGFYGGYTRSGIGHLKENTGDASSGMADVNENDKLPYGGAVIRTPELSHFFRLGVFGQVAHSSSDVGVKFVDHYPLEDGTVLTIPVNLRMRRSGVVGAYGANMEFRPPHHLPTIVLRIGHSSGDSLAAETAGGLFLSVTPTIDPIPVISSVGNGFRHLVQK